MTNRQNQHSAGRPTKTSITTGVVLTVLVFWGALEADRDVVGYLLGALASLMMLDQTLGRFVQLQRAKETDRMAAVLLAAGFRKVEKPDRDHFGGQG